MFTDLKELGIPEGEVVKIECDGVMLWEKITSRLPKEYQEVEWIGTDGNSWIVSDFTINELDNFTLYYTYSVPKVENVYMFGANSISNGASRFLHRYGQFITNRVATGGAVGIFAFIHDNNFHSYKIDCIHGDNITVYQDNSLLTTTTYYNMKDFRTIGILCNNYSGTPSSYKATSGCKIAELRFVDNTTGTDVFNPVPCYRKSDGVIGMYDTVTGKFYTNQGTGSFTKGSEV